MIISRLRLKWCVHEINYTCDDDDDSALLTSISFFSVYSTSTMIRGGIYTHSCLWLCYLLQFLLTKIKSSIIIFNFQFSDGTYT